MKTIKITFSSLALLLTQLVASAEISSASINVNLQEEKAPVPPTLYGIFMEEISHAFDDWGSQYDGEGRLLTPPGWFTREDLARFKAKTRALVAQYSAYAPVPGFPINGELTLGENIADNAGLAVAFKAYVLSLGGVPAPVIDGFTGAQRFFLGYAQSYVGKSRDSEAIMAIKADPHSPDRFRGTLPEMNLAAFDEAFDVKPGDPMYRPPDRRIVLW